MNSCLQMNLFFLQCCKYPLENLMAESLINAEDWLALGKQILPFTVATSQH